MSVSAPPEDSAPPPPPKDEPPPAPRPRAASPTPRIKRGAPAAPVPRSGLRYPPELEDYAPYETQTLGLVANFQALSLNRLHSCLQATMVQPR